MAAFAVTVTAAVGMVDPASAAVSDRDGAGRDSRYLPAGSEVCNFGFLSDDQHGHGYVRSETLCLTVGDRQAAAATPAPAEVAGGTEVAGETQTAPAPAAAPAPSSSLPQVMGEVLSVPELPRTGPADDLRLLAGSVLALGGLALVASARRRR